MLAAIRHESDRAPYAILGRSATESEAFTMEHPRITIDPAVMAGKPVIRRTRIPVEMILRKLGAGWNVAEVLNAWPHLTVEDVQAALMYAADVIGHEEIILEAPDRASSGG